MHRTKRVELPAVLRNSTGFVVYEIDLDCCDYSDKDDMLSTNHREIKVTITDDPANWAKENLGLNETPLGMACKTDDGRVMFRKTLFGQKYDFKLLM